MLFFYLSFCSSVRISFCFHYFRFYLSMNLTMEGSCIGLVFPFNFSFVNFQDSAITQEYLKICN
uniref:Uncharacterized protein n=1 Tax=Cannabis sativa TaxID=3483 RepID=A0A803QU48_CANSA